MKSHWNALYKTQGQLWNRETLTLPSKVLRGKRVLELGCGNGKTLVSIVGQKPALITAVDFSQEALSAAKNRFGSKRNQIEFVEAEQVLAKE